MCVQVIATIARVRSTKLKIKKKITYVKEQRRIIPCVFEVEEIKILEISFSLRISVHETLDKGTG